jgi:hypothetical protein
MFRRVMKHDLRIKRYTYQETSDLDKELDSLYRDLPECLAMRPIHSYGFTVPAYAIMYCVKLEQIYLWSVQNSEEDRARKLHALERSYKIWAERKHLSQEAARAARIFATMLSKVQHCAHRTTRHSTHIPDEGFTFVEQVVPSISGFRYRTGNISVKDSMVVDSLMGPTFLPTPPSPHSLQSKQSADHEK